MAKLIIFNYSKILKYIMKKIAIIASIICATMNVMAAVTPTGKLNITISSASQENKVLRLRQHTSFTDAFDNGWDAEAVADGGIYVVSGSKHYTSWASNEFANLPVGFGATEDNNYTLTFSNFGGDDITFKDVVTGDELTLSASTTYPFIYNFTITDALKNTSINDRFIINYVAPTPVVAICFSNNQLDITGHEGETLVITNLADDSELVNEASITAAYHKDFTPLNLPEKTRLLVTLNGVKYRITVNPVVTPYVEPIP